MRVVLLFFRMTNFVKKNSGGMFSKFGGKLRTINLQSSGNRKQKNYNEVTPMHVTVKLIKYRKTKASREIIHYMQVDSYIIFLNKLFNGSITYV